MKSDTVFLEYNGQQHTYGEFHRFRSEWKEQRTLTQGVHLIDAEPRLDAVFEIAACWVEGIPFSVMPAGPAGQVARSVLEGLDEFKHAQHGTGDHQLFSILFTSGTTAEPKPVPLKRSTMLAAAVSSRLNYPLQAGECWLHTLPLNHIGGISMICRAIQDGYGLYLMDRFDAGPVATVLSECPHVTGASLVPTQLKKLLEQPHLMPHSKFRGILLGGGPVEPGDITACKNLGLPVTPSFGMTETCAQCLATPLSNWYDAPAGTCGIPLPGIEAELREDPDDTGLSVLWVRGQQIFDGYAGSQEPIAFDGQGWFCTGDYATKDKQGYYYIQMRRSDRIVSGGENVNPLEIEHHLAELGLFCGDVAVIGLPDPVWGQAVTIVTTDQELQDISRVKALLSDRLDRFKIPKSIIMVSDIPRTASGKIKRAQLSQQLSGLP